MGRMLGRMVFATLFIAGGVGHFVLTDAYVRIVPPYLPQPRALVWISGIAEFALGVMLLARPTRPFAAWGLIALLVAVFPANVFMWQHPDVFGVPPWVCLLRLPLQGLLIAWAWAYTRPTPDPRIKVGAAPVAPLLLIGLTFVAAIGGCSVGGPTLGRLTKGTTARVQAVGDRPVVVYFAASEETLPVGTVVKVVDDEEGTVNQVDRKVLVGFNEGPHQGLAAFVRRSDLEPDR